MVKAVTEAICLARYGGLKEDIKEIKGLVNIIRDNHLHHINLDLQVLKTYFKIIGFVLGALCVALINIIFRLGVK